MILSPGTSETKKFSGLSGHMPGQASMDIAGRNMTNTHTSDRQRKRRKGAIERRNFWKGFAFASPWLIGFLLFQIYPIGAAFYYSATDFNMFRAPQFVAWDNYINLFQDKNVLISFQNTAYMVVIGLPICLTFALLVALIMNAQAKGMPLFRTIYYLPSVVPVMATALLFLWVMNSRYGLLNTLLGKIGIKGPYWLNDPRWTKPTLIIMDCWRSGSTAVIFLAALQNVPETFYEAAEIDGAGTFQKFFRITLPLISPTIQFQLIIGIISMFQYFSQAFVFNLFTGEMGQVTGGGPGNSLLFYSINIYREAFDFLNMGYASAQAVILFIIVIVMTFISLRVSERFVNYDYE